MSYSKKRHAAPGSFSIVHQMSSLVRVIQGDMDWIWSVCVTNGKYVVSGSSDNKLRVHNLKTGNWCVCYGGIIDQLKVCVCPPTVITCCRFAPPTKTCLSPIWKPVNWFVWSRDIRIMFQVFVWPRTESMWCRVRMIGPFASTTWKQGNWFVWSRDTRILLKVFV